MSTRFTIRIIIAAITAFAVLIVISLAVANRFQRNRTLVEQYEVYSSYLNEDLKDGNLLNDPLVVIQDRTIRSSVGVGTSLLDDFRHLFYILFYQRRIQGTSPGTYYNFKIRNIWTEKLEPRFNLTTKYEFATENEVLLYGQTEFNKRFPGHFGYFALSAVGFNSTHTEAYLYVEHNYGMAGHGEYVLMRKINNKWQSIERQYAWIS